jgi:hypothetical protein
MANKRRRGGPTPFLQGLSAPQLQALEELQQSLPVTGKDMATRLRVGRLLLKARPGGADGRAWFLRLHEHLGGEGGPCPVAALYRLVRFAEAFTAADAKDLERVGADGAEALLRLTKAKERRRLLKRAAKEGWSNRRVRQEVQDLLGHPDGRGRRRPHEVTRHVQADVALREVLRRTWHWLALGEGLWSGKDTLGRRLSRLGAGRKKAKGPRQDLRDAVEGLKKIAGAAKDLGEDLVRCLEEHFDGGRTR